jgi:hypothetical protein
MSVTFQPHHHAPLHLKTTTHNPNMKTRLSSRHRLFVFASNQLPVFFSPVMSSA